MCTWFVSYISPALTLLILALSNQHGKSKAEKEADAKKLGIDVQRQEVQDILDSLELDDSDYDTDDEPEQVAVTNDNNEEVLVEAVEVFREKTIEDIIEEQRQQLAANGVPGTPVNSETFAAWRAKKLAQRQADAEARLKAEQTKKKGGKGLCKYQIKYTAVVIKIFDRVFYCVYLCPCVI